MKLASVTYSAILAAIPNTGRTNPIKYLGKHKMGGIQCQKRCRFLLCHRQHKRVRPKVNTSTTHEILGISLSTGSTGWMDKG